MIEPIRWLEDTLWFLGVSDIRHQTFITHHGERFCCNVSFNIPSKWDGPEEILEISIAGTVVLNERIAERNAMRMCLSELGINGYIIHDFSYFWCEALDKGIANVAAVSKLTARDNDADVV